MSPRDVMTAEAFMNELGRQVPEAAAAVAEHLEFMQGTYLHLLLPDLLQLATGMFHSGQSEPLGRLQNLVATAMTDGEDDLQNAVAVSFIEHLGAFPAETPEFIQQLPSELRAELQRQHDWAAKHPGGKS